MFGKSKTDELFFLSAQGAVNSAALFPDRVQRGASGRILSVRTGVVNAAWRHSQNWNFSADFARDGILGGTLELYGRWVYFERYERQLLADAKVADASHEIRINDFALTAGLTQAELDFIKPYLDRQLLPARTPLFRAGQKGDRLYLLARGAVSVVAEEAGAAGKYRRIVTLAPGVIFGESAMLVPVYFACA